MLVGLDVLRIRFNDLGEDQYYQAICSASLITKDSFSAFVPNRMRRIVLKAINPDLDERYGSALEMRRDLERLNYKGSWTVGASGEFSGTDGARQFRFEMEPRHDNRFDVTCFNKRVSSGRETRIKRFCISNLTETQARKAVDKFVKAVVEGV